MSLCLVTLQVINKALQMSSFASLINYDVFDTIYKDYMSDTNVFVLECFKHVHKSVNENLTSMEECKKIVYEHDVIEVLDVWEGQAQCARVAFYEKPTYKDFVLVPIYQEVFKILEDKYEIEFKKDIKGEFISLDDEEIPWSCIYWRGCFDD